MKAFFKGLLIFFIIILLLGAITVALLFTLVNSFKYMTYSSAKMEKVYAAFNADEIKFIAHRGLSSEEYQNTAEAFRLAAEDSTVWGIETDIWVTGDGHYVCMHDADSLDGVDNVRDITLAEALSTPLRKNEHNKKKYPDDDFAPTLEEYLDICKGGGKVAVIELKDKYMTEAEIDGVLEIIKSKGVEVSFGSFHFEKLRYIRSKDADVILHLFTFVGLPRDMADAGFTSEEKLKRVIEERINLSCNYLFLTKALADMFHDAGLAVGVWTVNDKKTVACLYNDYGVDYVTSDKSRGRLFG